MIKGTSTRSLTNAKGQFYLTKEKLQGPQTVTAAKEGYFIAGQSVSDKDSSVVLNLRKVQQKDNQHYEWVDPRPNDLNSENCGNCHREIFEEWELSAHANSASGKRFLNLYNGTDWHGNKNHGWNLSNDHPDGLTVCASCHAPAANASAPTAARGRQG